MIVKMLDILSLVKNVVAFKPRFRVRKSDIKTKKDRYRTSRHFDEKKFMFHFLFWIQSNLYMMTTHGTTQKRLS